MRVLLFNFAAFFNSLPSSSFAWLKDMASLIALVLWLFALQVLASPYDPREVDYNLNTDRDAKQPLQYAGQWEGHNYTKSPDNWRFPFYTLFLDRFVNGDPTNDNINGTLFEHDPLSTLFRHGGDAKGLTDSLDYLQGMGVKVRCRYL